jgi:hypothetical protein
MVSQVQPGFCLILDFGRNGFGFLLLFLFHKTFDLRFEHDFSNLQNLQFQSFSKNL